MFIVDAIVNLFSKLVAKKTEDKRALAQDHVSDNELFAAQTKTEDQKEIAIAKTNANNILLKDFSVFALTAIIVFSGFEPYFAAAFFNNIVYAVPQQVLYSYWCMFGALWGFNIWGKR